MQMIYFLTGQKDYIYLCSFFHKYLWRAYYILGIVIGTKDAVINKTALVSSGSLRSSGEKDNKHMNNNFKKWRSVMK